MKTFLKRMLLILGALLGLLILFHLVENWRGARALARWQAASIAAGEPQDLEQLAPPRIPDAENFTRHPSIAEDVAGRPQKGGPVLPTALADSELNKSWERGHSIDLEAIKASLNVAELGSLLAPFTAQLQGLEEASRRPHSRVMDTYDVNIPALLGMRQRAKVLSLRATLALREGRSEAALADILTILRVAQHLEREPHLITQLLHIAFVKLSFQPIWEGLHDHRWNDSQLARLQEAIGGVDLLKSWHRTWVGEGTYTRGIMLKLASAPLWHRQVFQDSEPGKGRLADHLFFIFFPKGWIYQNLLNMERRYKAQFLDVTDPASHLLHARASDRAAAAWSAMPRTPYTMWAKPAAEDFSVQNLRMGHAQSTLDQAFISCALERYHLAHKTYPEGLDALTPAFAAKLPRDIIDGKPLHYRKISTDTYLLYSIGWNGTDEGGQITYDAQKQGRIPSTEVGDWVWMGAPPMSR
jgi:hypothetical protein